MFGYPYCKQRFTKISFTLRHSQKSRVAFFIPQIIAPIKKGAIE